MAKSILIVAALLAVLLYSAAFFMWNAETKVNVITFDLQGAPWWIGDVPIGFLPLAGAVIGALIMAVAAWLPWAKQRDQANRATEKLSKAVEKFNQLKERLQARNETIEQLHDEIEQLQQQAAERPPEGQSAAGLDAPDLKDTEQQPLT